MISYITLGLAVVAVVLCVILLLRRPPLPDYSALERSVLEELRSARQENNQALQQAVREAALLQNESQRHVAERQDARLRELSEQLASRQKLLQSSVTDQMNGLDTRFKNVAMQNEQKLENIRRTVEERLVKLQTGNEKKLDEMRLVVDEKLQKTLDERLKQSFSLVNERLEQVHKGLGEMQTLATGVGDLKRVLSNVKTRGILGEIQLGAILEEILAPEQYDANVATVPGSAERVEYAVRLPGDGEGESVWLPVDAKFPADAYAALLDAYDTGDTQAVDTAGRGLEARIRAFAKDIHDKYIHVPQTTDFAVMFLPVEGLYAEVVRRGFVEKLQTDFKIVIAGPTTMAALLNSLQMGFRTLAIQKRTSEVWAVLGEVKTEFGKFERVLAKTKQHLDLASRDIEELAGVRTRQIQRRLKDVTVLTISGGEDAGDEEEEAEAVPAGFAGVLLDDAADQ